MAKIALWTKEKLITGRWDVSLRKTLLTPLYMWGVALQEVDRETQAVYVDLVVNAEYNGQVQSEMRQC